MKLFLTKIANLFVSGLTLGIGLGFIVSCAPSAAPNPPAQSAPKLARELVFYDWPEDMPPSVLEAFTREYGVQITYLTYNSDAEVLASLTSGKNYDVVALNSYLLPQITPKKLLAQLDHNNIPNFQHIAPNFKDLEYDRDNQFSVPYNWGTVGLLVHSNELTRPITHWADLWDLPPTHKIAIRDEPRDVLGAALKSLGYSINTENPAELAAALQQLQKIRSQVIFTEPYAEAAIPLLVNGDAVALIGWADDARFGRRTHSDLDYILPGEGAILWGDSFVIPARSPNKYTAELFLNFILRPEISAQITNENQYATPNESARAFIEPDILNDPVVFPATVKLTNAEVLLSLSPEGEMLYNQAWAQFKAAEP